MIDTKMKNELLKTKTAKEFLQLLRGFLNMPKSKLFTYGEIKRLTDDEVYKHFESMRSELDLETPENHSDPRPRRRSN